MKKTTHKGTYLVDRYCGRDERSGRTQKQSGDSCAEELHGKSPFRVFYGGSPFSHKRRNINLFFQNFILMTCGFI
jgi:hypothetical protein